MPGIALRALLIEDSEDDAALIVRELRRSGYELAFQRVDTPAAMAEALDQREWDVIISDYSMPRFSTFAALSLMQERGLDVPFIIVSGAMGEDTAVAGMKAGAQDYLLKSNLKRLAPAIAREVREANERRAHRHAEQERLRAREQEQEARALAAAARESDRRKTELLSTVAHELRTPLASIKGFSTLLLTFEERLPVQERRDYLQEIDNAAGRLQDLIENLLQLSRIESGTLEIRQAPTSAAGPAERAVADARRLWPNRVITYEAADNLPLVSLDERRIQQVIANLLDNAIKYSPDGGEVEVRVSADADGWSRISVADHGMGIPAADVERIFERFYRVENERIRDIGGTGLGLTICRRIVEAHGGTIGVSSVEGQGSVFTIRLPAAGQTPQERAEEAGQEA